MKITLSIQDDCRKISNNPKKNRLYFFTLDTLNKFYFYNYDLFDKESYIKSNKLNLKIQNRLKHRFAF